VHEILPKTVKNPSNFIKKYHINISKKALKLEIKGIILKFIPDG